MRHTGSSIFVALMALLAAAQIVSADVPAPLPAPTPAGIEFFESRIRPVLVEQCYRCHSAKAEKLKAKLYLDTREGILKGGESDLPLIVPGKLDDGTLIRAIRHEDEALQMPPKKKLPPEQIADFEAWIKMGAPVPATPAAALAAPTSHPTGMTIAEGRKFWSFIPPREPVVPDVKQPEWSHSEVDRFVFAKLAEKNLSPSPPADKRTLIRRATYDLIGLPPTPKEIENFQADASPNAFEKVVDRLLASPHYGERWGRYWLDVARYADTKGYMFEEERRFAFSYTYRDWVVRSLNEDLPYDQFLIQQIAADRLELKDDKRPLAALGFLTLGRRFIGNPHDIIDDRIDVVTRGTMGLTVSCARCHDHKYDPIPTADYYSLYGVFASSIEPAELPLIGGEKPAQAAEYEAEHAKRIAERDNYLIARHAERVAELRSAEKITRYMLVGQKGITPPELNFETIEDGKSLAPFVITRWGQYLKAAAARKDPVFVAWQRFATLPADQFATKAAVVSAELMRTPSANVLVSRLVAFPPPKSIQEVADRYGKLLATFDGAAPALDPQIEVIRLALRADESPTAVPLASAGHILSTPENSARRGLQQKIDELAATHPGSPQRAMAMQDAPTPTTPRVFVRGNPGAAGGKEVPRQFPAIVSPDDRKPFQNGSGRLEMAKQIASKDNPLTARVMVNRIWQHHFGAGLVRTPSDFGTRGEKPTHPELLDFLARRFTEMDGWSIKKLHKRMMLSAAYQQGSLDNAQAKNIDPENRLLWRMNPRRLDFEAMRDSLLAASGTIDLTVGGRPVDILAQPFVPRRSIYAFIDRQNLPGMFRTFDFASPDATNAQRFNTSVPQQALFMMNSPFVIEQSKKLAAREDIAKQTDSSRRVAQLYLAIFGRSPRAEEIEMGVKFIQSEESQPTGAMATESGRWSYGFGEFDESTQRLKNFYALPHFTGSMWRGSEVWPDPKIGWAMLSADGGHAGNDAQHAVIRRWTAPRDCTISISGTIAHPMKEGDGVRARIVTTADGLLASWNVHHKEANTHMDVIPVKQGQTVDFVVDLGRAGDVGYDNFTWPVKITKEAPTEAVAGDDSGGVWDATSEFSGPAAKPTMPLNAWERYAQVLLESNEFAFVD